MVVTGATGLVGSEVAAQADTAGWIVERWGLSQAGAGGLQRVDLRHGRVVYEALGQAGPSVVVHCAYSKTDPAVTVDGAAHVAQWCAANGARLVHLSSDVVFPGHGGVRYRDHDRPAPVSGYGRLKLEAEQAVAHSGASAVWIRTSLVLRADPPGPNELLARVAAGSDPDRPKAFTDETRCPLDVHDLAAVVLWAATADRTGPLHVVGPELVSRHDLTVRLAAAAGLDWRAVQRVSAPDGDRPRHLELERSAGVPHVRSLEELGLPRPR